MKIRLLVWIGLALVVGLIIGGYGGFRLGKSPVLNSALQKNARDIQSDISTLKLLRDSQSNKAIEVMEAGLDDNLVLFAPWDSYERVTDQTKMEIQKAITQAKSYRAAHPRKSSRRHVDAMVSNVFANESFP